MHKSKSKLLENPIILAILLLIIGTLISLLMSIFTQDRSILRTSHFISVTIIGSLYAEKFEKAMPKKLKLKTSAIHTIISILLGLYYFWEEYKDDWAFAIAIHLGIGLIYFFFTYWMLGISNKMFQPQKNKVDGQQK